MEQNPLPLPVTPTLPTKVSRDLIAEFQKNDTFTNLPPRVHAYFDPWKLLKSNLFEKIQEKNPILNLNTTNVLSPKIRKALKNWNIHAELEVNQTDRRCSDNPIHVVNVSVQQSLQTAIYTLSFTVRNQSIRKKYWEVVKISNKTH